MTGFLDRLAAAVQQTGVGRVYWVGPAPRSAPEPLVASHGPAEAAKQFCLGVIDVVAGHVPSVKPQVAFLKPWAHPALPPCKRWSLQHGLQG